MLEDIEKHKVTAMVVVPVMLSRILAAMEQMEKKPDLSSLRIVFVSGSALGAELAERALKDLGPVVYNMYGSTEIAFATIAEPKHLRTQFVDGGAGRQGCAGSRSSTRTARSCRRARSGGSSSAPPSRSRATPAAATSRSSTGMLSSGDVGYFDEHGLLYISGRDDEMIVSGGENVFPAEVEDLITGHPDVVEATAIGVEDKEWGHRLRAFVVKKQDARPRRGHRQALRRDHLARYKVPREVIFLDELPRNPTGKILKRELREMEID